MTLFGWGQRAYLGQSLTQDELVVACGGLAWAFKLNRKIDPATSLEIDVPLNKSNSLLIIKPDPFQMVSEPRSAARRPILSSSGRLPRPKIWGGSKFPEDGCCKRSFCPGSSDQYGSLAAGCHFDTSASRVKISEDRCAIWCFMGLYFLQMENI